VKREIATRPPQSRVADSTQVMDLHISSVAVVISEQLNLLASRVAAARIHSGSSSPSGTPTQLCLMTSTRKSCRAALIHSGPQIRGLCLTSSSGRSGKVACTSARINLRKGQIDCAKYGYTKESTSGQKSHLHLRVHNAIVAVAPFDAS
jgi:hypothetical protein